MQPVHACVHAVMAAATSSSSNPDADDALGTENAAEAELAALRALQQLLFAATSAGLALEVQLQAAADAPSPFDVSDSEILPLTAWVAAGSLPRKARHTSKKKGLPSAADLFQRYSEDLWNKDYERHVVSEMHDSINGALAGMGVRATMGPGL